MRFLFVSDFLPNWNSGAEGSLLSIGKALEIRGHRVEYLWKDAKPGILPHRRLQDLFELPGRQLKRVSVALQKISADVVILSQPYSYLVYEQLTDLYPQTLFLNRTHGWEDRMSDSWRQLGWRSAGFLERQLSDLASGYMRKACERTVQASQGIIAGSDLCASYIKTHYRPNKGSVVVIPYGVDSQLSTRLRLEGSQRMLFVGQYLPRKGSTMLENILPGIAQRYPEASMTFVVPPEDVKKVASAYGPAFGERLSVLPWMAREKLASVYGRHDVLLFPSYFEGFGKVFLEGMATGLCVVGFREGGLPSMAAHSRDALICETGDVHAFRMMTELALSNPVLAREIGGRARGTAQRFTWERHAIETENFCHRLKYGEARTAMAS
jgi:glycosyltransferase involved in cell wall biosynthesis